MNPTSHPTIAASSIDAIGNTPLIRLRTPSEATGCEILGKAEWMNPGGSIKDRAAKAIILDALAKGTLKPGGLVVESTAGNTGIGLATVANALGLRCEIVMPDTQSAEKKAAIRNLGATLIERPALPYKNPENHIHYAGRLAKQRLEEDNQSADPRGVIWADQFDNTANRESHRLGTAVEIWQQTGGSIDGFVCAVGSGGTLAGVAEGLRARAPKVAIALADPHGSALWGYYAEGELRSEGNSITEGIGQGRITGNLEGLQVDHALRISDSEALEWIFRLIKEEGISVGTSSGINIAGAVELAKLLGPGHTIVTVLCDSATRYAGKLFDAEFLKTRGLPFLK
ncbi:MAG: cysteine synthase A [Actinomycetia bacterium]|nr:cysteine synthase A [Actinomycetes bacterium]